MIIDIHKVRALRIKKSWSQEQLSESCGLSLRTIQRIENGSNISMESLKVLAMALEVDPAELLMQEKHLPTNPIESVKMTFREFANFTGTATRFEYWWFLLFMVLVLAVASLIHDRLTQIVAILFLVPFLAVGARRLNDIGESIWWQLFLFVPFGQIIVFWKMAEKTKNPHEE